MFSGIEFDLVPLEKPVCIACKRKVAYLVSASPDETPFCPECFSERKPYYRDFLVEFSALLEVMKDLQNDRMTQEDMHELYGNKE